MRGVCTLTLVVAGCGGARERSKQAPLDTDASTPLVSNDTSAPKACDLLAADEVSKAIAIEVKAGVTASDYMGDSQCRFDRADSTKAAVMVSLHRTGDIENYRNVPGSTSVEGVGDVAVWNASTAQIAVKSGAAVFSISFLFMDVQKTWAIQLARLAVPRLGP